MVGSRVVTSTSSERSNGPFSFGGFADSAILRSSLAGFSGVIVNVEPSSPSKTRRGKRKPWMTRYDGRVFGSPSNERLSMAWFEVQRMLILVHKRCIRGQIFANEQIPFNRYGIGTWRYLERTGLRRQKSGEKKEGNPDR